jgi:hypothetical protein
MSNQKTVTLRWISEATGELVEWPVPAHVAEALARGTRRARPSKPKLSAHERRRMTSYQAWTPVPSVFQLEAPLWPVAKFDDALAAVQGGMLRRRLGHDWATTVEAAP